MVHRKYMTSAAALGAAFLAAGCAKDAAAPTLVDAATVFAEHEGLFQSIRAAYPGPYEDFVRIPARDPAENSRLDNDFLAVLREDIPVEFLDFFPIGDTGKDELDVVLWRYHSGGHWNTVSLIYFSMPMTLAEDAENMRAFENCDDEAVAWLEANKKASDVSAFCRINDHWQAFQKVE